jgi:hypothetical protein
LLLSLFKAIAIMFQPPNGKPFSCQTLHKRKPFVGVANKNERKLKQVIDFKRNN